MEKDLISGGPSGLQELGVPYRVTLLEESGYSTRQERKRQQFDPAISASPILHNWPSAHTKATICSSTGGLRSLMIG